MRFLILKDTLITTDDLHRLENEFVDFINEHTGLIPVFYVQEQDYSSVPTEEDQDGDLKPTKAYTTKLMNDVYAKYGNYGIDSVVMLVHRNNWVFDGIWGTNWSNLYHQYHVHLCRFDHKSLPNSLGTLYHEWMHSLDVLIKVHTGYDLTELFKVPYDKFIVHGGRPDKENTTQWKYIKWKDNTNALVAMAPYLKQAYQARKELYLAPYRAILLKVATTLRAILNRKNGVPRH